MRHIRRHSVFFLLVIFCALCAAGNAGAATPNPKEAARLYDGAAKDWRELLRDQKRGETRDPWLNLEKRFLAAATRDPGGDAGAKAQFQAARCREELAKRSHLASDWKYAANHYLDLAKKFPRHNLADDGLFQAASIMASRLNSPQEARATAQSVIDKYPKGDMAANARKLLGSLPKTTAPAQQNTGRSSGGAAPAERAQSSVLSQAAPSRATTLNRILCRGTARRSTVLLELDGAASYRHQYLAATQKGAPARLVIDIDGVASGPEVKSAVTLSGMAVSRVRTTGVKGRKGVRVTIDLKGVRHYTVDSGASPPGIHVQCSTAADLAGGIAPPAGGKSGPVVLGSHGGSAASGRPGTLVEQLGLTVRTIMIDAGHGGKDPGAMGNDIRESAVTLSLAKLVGERLRKQGYTVLYTRQKDAYVALDQRPVIANNKKADLFISLHVNASKDKKTNGLETYFLDMARTSSAATVAARENAVTAKNISDLQFILTDLMLTSKLQESQDLAAIIHSQMFARLRQAGFTVNDNGVRSAPFYVLMGARMPAVLVEIGYLSNTDDARRIKNAKYLERLADGIVLGVTAYRTKLGRFTGK
ncbi:N-acetylmuramoyl-L-alanine amidase [Desulfovibrio sp. OttesenSCG-928-O18]|nr:N-acetylmuramoyl-L-alanine amidase [Desulfovibrio sp. OttesenSCG-928-O18]